MNKQRLLRIFFIIVVVLGFCALLLLPRINHANDDKIKIITTNFPSYDIARALTEDLDVSLNMLIKPGVDLHDYEPSPQDIIAIKSADVFIYIGGESDTWVNDFTFSDHTLVIKLANAVHLKTENGSSDEIDEHIWASPANYLDMLSYTRSKLAKQYPDYSSQFATNLSIYGEEIKAIGQSFQKTKLIQPLIVADRFPFRYLADEFQLKYLAAFPGCAEQTEASAETIAELINAVKANHVPYIYTIEMSNTKIAQTIKDATGAEIRTLYSGHNLSQSDFDAGINMATIYQRNLEALKVTE